MEMNRDYNNLVKGFSARSSASYLNGAPSDEEVSNVSNNGDDISSLSSFEKGIYNEIEDLFKESHKNMLTASVKITQEAMNLMESDDLFKEKVISELSKAVWETQTDGVTPYHAMFSITEDGVTIKAETVSNYESTATKEAKLSYAKSQASGSFITSGFDQGDSNQVNLSSFVNSVLKDEEEKDYAQLWVQQSIISSYNQNISNSYSQSLLNFNK